MRLILQKDVKNLGKAGDQVLVKKGYARNFLIPKGHALPLNKDRLRVWKHQQGIISAKKRKAVAERKELIDKLSSIKLKFEKESQKDGRLFGSVTSFEISQALEKLHNLSVDKRDISPSILKTAGEHKISISLDPENKTEMLISVKGKVTKKKSAEEAEESTKDTEEKKTKEKIGFFQKAKMAISLKSKKSAEEEEETPETAAQSAKAPSTEEVKETSETEEDSK